MDLLCSEATPVIGKLDRRRSGKGRAPGPCKRRSWNCPDIPLVCSATALLSPEAPSSSRVDYINGAGRILIPQRSKRHKQAQHNLLAWTVVQKPVQPAYDAVTIMNEIKSATTWQQLQEVQQRAGPCMNHVHISAMLTHLAQLSQRAFLQHGTFHATSASQSINAESMQGSHSSPLAVQTALLQRRQLPDTQHPQHHTTSQPSNISDQVNSQLPKEASTFVESLLRLSAAHMNKFKNRQAANCLWAVAKLEINPSNAWVSKCLAVARNTLNSSTPQQLANIAYAVALQPHWLDNVQSRGQWLDQLFTACSKQIAHFKPQELASLLWSAAQLHQQQPLPASSGSGIAHAIEQALTAACERAEELSTQELSNVLWAAGKLCGEPGKAGIVMPGRNLNTRLPAVIQRPSTRHLKKLLTCVFCSASVSAPAGLSAVMLSLPSLGLRLPRSWLHHFLTRTESLLPQCKPRELSNVLLALAYLGYDPPAQWLASWTNIASQRMHTFPSQELCNVVWALCRLKLQPSKPFMAQMLLAAAGCMTTFNTEELFMLTLSLSQLGCKPDQAWQQLLLATSYNHIPQLHYTQLSTFVWSLARMGCEPPSHWNDVLLPQLQSQLPHMDARSLATTLHGLALMNHLPEPAFCNAYLHASKQRLPQANVHDLASILWAVAALDMRPPPSWMVACMQRCIHLLTVQIQAQQGIERIEHASTDVGHLHTDEHNHTTSYTDENNISASSAEGTELQAAEATPSQASNSNSAVQSQAGLVSPETLWTSLPTGIASYADQTAGRKGGKIKDKARLVAARNMWSSKSLSMASWALARLGYQSLHSPHPVSRDQVLAQQFLDMSTQMTTDWQDWSQRKQVAMQVLQHNSGGDSPTVRKQPVQNVSHQTTVAVPDSVANDKKQEDAHPLQHTSDDQSSLPATPIDMDVLVLQGILDWSSACFDRAQHSSQPAGSSRRVVNRKQHVRRLQEDKQLDQNDAVLLMHQQPSAQMAVMSSALAPV